MDGELEKNVNAKEQELTKLFETSDSFKRTTPPFDPTFNPVYSNAYELVSNEQIFNFWHQHQILNGHQTLDFNFRNLHLNQNNQTNILSPYMHEMNFFSNVQPNYVIDPQFDVWNDRQAQEDASQLQHFLYKQQENNDYLKTRQFNTKSRPKKKVFNMKHNRIAIEDAELEKVEINLERLNLGPQFIKTTIKSEILNEFWNLYIYLSQISNERKSIQSILSYSEFELDGDYLPKYDMSLNQNHEYFRKCLFIEINLIDELLQMLNKTYKRQISFVLASTESILLEINISTGKYNAIAFATFKEYFEKKGRNPTNGDNLLHLRECLSNVALDCRKIGVNMFILKHYIQMNANRSDKGFPRNTFHGS